MVDLGLLTDASGTKLTDLGQLTFAETLDKKFLTLIDTINKLAEAISRGLGTAIQNIPQPAPLVIPVEYSYGGSSGEAAYASRGGLVTESGVQYLGRGGHVLPFRSRGSDTVPAMLTPGERVLSVDQAKAYAAGGRASGDAGGLGSGAIVSELQGLKQQLADQAQQAADRDRNLPRQIRDAILLAG